MVRLAGNNIEQHLVTAGTIAAGVLAAGFIAEAITNAYDEYTMILATTIAIAVMRAISALGYLFVKESLPKENRS